MSELDLDAIEARHRTARDAMTEDWQDNNAVLDAAWGSMYDVPALVAEVRRLRAFAQDIADHGLRADLTPTVDTRSASTVYTQMAGFLRRIDGGMRLRARGALIPDQEVTPRGDQQ